LIHIAGREEKISFLSHGCESMPFLSDAAALFASALWNISIAP
jgi:hypothetical protein